MSLNLRISRPRPRKSRAPLFWLFAAILFSAGWLAWLRGWQPAETFDRLQNLRTSDLAARFQRDVLPFVPPPLGIDIPQLEQLQTQTAPVAPPQSDAVVMVARQVIENPQSNAFTSDLYRATGKDDIPWPNIDGRTRVEIYEVQSGDSLWGISSRFGLDIDTLRWSNIELERNPDVLSVGTELNILPVQGAYHIVAEGDSIESIALLYGVAKTGITAYPPNGLFSPFKLENGQGIIVPYGRKGIKLPQPSLSWEAELAWPVVGFITTNFLPAHEALDIGAPYGSTVYAAAAGTITYADWAREGYGYTVIINHGNGLQTWYNHLKGALLPAGNIIERGAPIGEVGSTGHSTGPHVHFEVRVDGQRVNPLHYLPGNTPR